MPRGEDGAVLRCRSSPGRRWRHGQPRLGDADPVDLGASSLGRQGFAGRRPAPRPEHGAPGRPPTPRCRSASTRTDAAALPGDVAPDFSAGGATGRTTSARSVIALARTSRLTRKPTRSHASAASAGSGRSPGSTRRRRPGGQLRRLGRRPESGKVASRRSRHARCPGTARSRSVTCRH